MQQCSDKKEPNVAFYFMTENQVHKLLLGIKCQSLLGTVEEEGRLHYVQLDEESIENLSLRPARSVDTPKSLMFPCRERVAVYPAADYQWLPSVSKDNPVVMIGARGCDLVALRILDQVFLEGDFLDPFYAARREATKIFSVDCIQADPVCFCTLVDGVPYPTGGFDLNFSPLEGGYVVEIGSDWAKELAVDQRQLFQPATEQQLRDRDDARRQMTEALQEQNQEFAVRRSFPEIVKGVMDLPAWKQECGACVECGACSLVCPTCHCFMLYDQPSADEAGPHERVRSWDSCVFATYSRMAGPPGMKPSARPELRTRFENRYLHKFVWFEENLHCLGCVGCGRCVEACLGGVDIRQVLKRMEESEQVGKPV